MQWSAYLCVTRPVLVSNCQSRNQKHTCTHSMQVALTIARACKKAKANASPLLVHCTINPDSMCLILKGEHHSKMIQNNKHNNESTDIVLIPRCKRTLQLYNNFIVKIVLDYKLKCVAQDVGHKSIKPEHMKDGGHPSKAVYDSVISFTCTRRPRNVLQLQYLW